MSYLCRISVRNAPAFPAHGSSICRTAAEGAGLMRCAAGGNVAAALAVPHSLSSIEQTDK